MPDDEARQAQTIDELRDLAYRREAEELRKEVVRYVKEGIGTKEILATLRSVREALSELLKEALADDRPRERFGYHVVGRVLAGVARDLQVAQTEILTELGTRALARAERHDQAGERVRARLIRMFLSDNEHFPNEIRRKARGLWGWFGWIGRAAGLWIIAAAVFIPFLLLAAAHALARAHKRTFFSTHHLARKGGEAYPR